MISQLDFVSKDECGAYVSSIMKLRDHWIQRKEDLPIYTLGAASYLDAARSDDEKYRSSAKKNNDILWENFYSLYGRLAEVFSKKTGKPIKFAEELALPGFHIFLSHKMLEKPIAKCHFDLQFFNIKWFNLPIELDSPISFTAAVELPKEGGGLNYWEIEYRNYRSASDRELAELCSLEEPNYLSYEVGKLVLHEGLFLHQIAPGKDLGPDDKRITLQGHGVLSNGTYYLYW